MYTECMHSCMGKEFSVWRNVPKPMYLTGPLLWESQQAASNVYSETSSTQIIPHLSQHMMSPRALPPLPDPTTSATPGPRPSCFVEHQVHTRLVLHHSGGFKIKLLINTLFSNMFPPDFSLQLSDHPRISSSILAKGTNTAQGKMLIFYLGATQIETPVAHHLIAIVYKVLYSAEHYLQSPGSGKPSHLADAGCLDIQSNVAPNQFIKVKKKNK